MADLSKCKVTFTPPDYENPAVVAELLRRITGKDDFNRDVQLNLGGVYDELYEEEA